jgi:hypothetical protein
VSRRSTHRQKQQFALLFFLIVVAMQNPRLEWMSDGEQANRKQLQDVQPPDEP